MSSIKDYLLYRINRLLRWEDQDLLAMQQLAPLARTYLPWSLSAMRPSGLVKVLNDVVVHQRKCVVECGGGISTYFLGQLLKERGGELITIEHNLDWCNILDGFLHGQGLGGIVRIVHAPLAPTRYPWREKADWYDESIVTAAVQEKLIDLLLVDGPPAHHQSMRFARYPAVPFFRPRLAPAFTIVLDDVNRKGERAIVERWERELGIRMQIYLIDGNIAVGHSQHDWVV